MLAFVAGIMMAVSICELFPEARRQRDMKNGAVGGEGGVEGHLLDRNLLRSIRHGIDGDVHAVLRKKSFVIIATFIFNP